MKIKSNFIWLYSVLLFSAAVLLILISAMSQSRLTPSDAVTQINEQQAFNQTIQKSVTDLIKENENLRNELSSAKETISQLENEKNAFSIDNRQAALQTEASEFLIEAEMLFNKGKYSASRDSLQNVNANILTPQGKVLYDWLSGRLSNKGYKLQEGDR